MSRVDAVLVAALLCAAVSIVTLTRQLAAARYAAQHDPLTGLLNRAGLAEWWPTQRVALLLLDLDLFKEVNDTFGHDAGDEVLCEIGHRMTALQDVMAVCRLGGDEYVLAVPLARRVRTARLVASIVALPVQLGRGDVVQVRASVGVTCPEPAPGGLRVGLRQADAAMLRAKRDGLTVAHYDPAVDGPDVPLTRPAVRARDQRRTTVDASR